MRGLHARDGEPLCIAAELRDFRNAGGIRSDGADGQAGEGGELVGKVADTRLQVQANKLKIGGGEAGLKELAEGIDARFRARSADQLATGTG